MNCRVNVEILLCETPSKRHLRNVSEDRLRIRRWPNANACGFDARLRRSPSASQRRSAKEPSDARDADDFFVMRLSWSTTSMAGKLLQTHDTHRKKRRCAYPTLVSICRRRAAGCTYDCTRPDASSTRASRALQCSHVAVSLFLHASAVPAR